MERLGNAIRSIGVVNGALQAAFRYAKDRKQFGKQIEEFQGVRWKLADAAMREHAAKLVVYDSARRLDVEGRGGPSVAMAKCVANEAAMFIADTALQIFGAAGYDTELPIEAIFRRVRGWLIAGGTVEMMRNQVAEHLLDSKVSQWK